MSYYEIYTHTTVLEGFLNVKGRVVLQSYALLNSKSEPILNSRNCRIQDHNYEDDYHIDSILLPRSFSPSKCVWMSYPLMLLMGEEIAPIFQNSGLTGATVEQVPAPTRFGKVFHLKIHGLAALDEEASMVKRRKPCPFCGRVAVFKKEHDFILSCQEDLPDIFVIKDFPLVVGCSDRTVRFFQENKLGPTSFKPMVMSPAS